MEIVKFICPHDGLDCSELLCDLDNDKNPICIMRKKRIINEYTIARIPFINSEDSTNE